MTRKPKAGDGKPPAARRLPSTRLHPLKLESDLLLRARNKRMTTEVMRERDFNGSFLEYRLLMLEQEKDELKPLAVWTALKLWFDEDGHTAGTPIPTWIMNYLRDVSTEIQSLRADTERPGKERVKDLPLILGFVGHNVNIFDRDDSNFDALAVALFYDDLRRKGHRVSDAIAAVMKLLHLEDERSVRRIIKKGRTAFAVLPGQN